MAMGYSGKRGIQGTSARGIGDRGHDTRGAVILRTDIRRKWHNLCYFGRSGKSAQQEESV